MKPTRPLIGLVAAVHTPFRPDGSLHLDVVPTQAAHLRAHRVDLAFVGGSTGEAHSLSLEERRALARRWTEEARGPGLGVVVHVGANCLADAQALAAQAEELGAVAISAVAPSYFKPRDVDTLVACCAEVAAAAPRTPFYFYDIPSLTGVHLSMPDFLERGEGRIPTLAGIKFTSADLADYQLCLRAAGGAFDVPYGVDEWLLAALALGARGAVGSTYNFAAPLYQRMLRAFAAGDLAAAREEQLRSAELVRLLAGYGYMGAAKAVMAIVGVDVGPPRLPQTGLSPGQAAALRRRLESLGFFDWIRG
ncbi:MAG TPA: dihydrodipicolinate synthase family protein [Vicinamibacteria bacterium]|nr:dihydrodipicolinate synthase family protein [Vicinamibacteria bacterium]